MERESARKRQAASLNLPRCNLRRVADGSKLLDAAAAKLCRKVKCKVASLLHLQHKSGTTHTLPSSPSPTLSLSFPIPLTSYLALSLYHLSIVYHRRTLQDERNKFLVSLGISLRHCFRFRRRLARLLATCCMRHAAYLWHATNVYLNYIKQ